MAYFEVNYSNGYCGCEETHYIEAENESEAIDIAYDEIELYGFYDPDSRFIDRDDYESEDEYWEAIEDYQGAIEVIVNEISEEEFKDRP